MNFPYYPIIYIRGYAATDSEREDTVATPYMGFNLGSVKIRQKYDKSIYRHIFESPLIRLRKDYGYEDIYLQGTELKTGFPERPIFIFRYYEKEWKTAKDDELISHEPRIEELGEELSDFIQSLKKGYKKQGLDPTEFKVNLVAHSMGGLICRCMLQNNKIRNLHHAYKDIHKVFTYGTPHNGIDLGGVNVGFWPGSHRRNFNRRTMKQYMDIPLHKDANDLDDKFPLDRFFCLVGTNSRDYKVAKGFARKLAGSSSDGLVKIKNAYVKNTHRAYVHKSHSGDFGLVNSEEGYQNLVRFLFGDVNITGRLSIRGGGQGGGGPDGNNEPNEGFGAPLPQTLYKAIREGKDVKCSYYFSSAVSVRGANSYYLNQRSQDHGSAIIREYNELNPGVNHRPPFLFSAYLDTNQVREQEPMAGLESDLKHVILGVDLKVTATDYEVDGIFWDQFIRGDNIYRDRLYLNLALERQDSNQLVKRVRYSFDDNGMWQNGEWSEAELNNEGRWDIRLHNAKGFNAILELTINLIGYDSNQHAAVKVDAGSGGSGAFFDNVLPQHKSVNEAVEAAMRRMLNKSDQLFGRRSHSYFKDVGEKTLDEYSNKNKKGKPDQLLTKA